MPARAIDTWVRKATMISFLHWFVFCVAVKFTATGTNKQKGKKKNARPLRRTPTHNRFRRQECARRNASPGSAMTLGKRCGYPRRRAGWRRCGEVRGSHFLLSLQICGAKQLQDTFPRTLTRCAQEPASVRAGKTCVDDDASVRRTDVGRHLLLEQPRPLNIW